MKIILYNSNSTKYDAELFHYEFYPSCKNKLESFIASYTSSSSSASSTTSSSCGENEIIIISQLPALFLLDLDKQGNIDRLPNVKYKILNQNISSRDFAEEIIKEKADLAISFSAFYKPFDWQGIKDALIAKYLRQKNIKVITNSITCQNICFDKKLTGGFLASNNFTSPESLYVNHELFFAHKSKQDLVENVYAEDILEKVENLTFPIIIKDSCGLSSYGAEVLTTYKSAKAYLLSKKNNGDKIIQELIKGQHFGLEIYGSRGNYYISSPFMLSLNQYMITSPKQSIKAGPFNSEAYKIKELKSEIERLAELLEIDGIAQVDLVFDGSKWFIIEINPRLSGMTNLICSSCNKTYFDLIINAQVKDYYKNIREEKVFSIKLPLLDEKTKKELAALPFIKEINQTKNDGAKQKREEGYCDVIICEGGKSLKENLDYLKTSFKALIDENFYEKALLLLEKLK